MRVLVTGSRAWPAPDAVARALAPWIAGHTGSLVIVHGDCPSGADAIARRVATDNGIRHEPHPAEWGRYGVMAGPIRNQEMVDLGADACLAFPLGRSIGTRDCMHRAKKAGIPVIDYGAPIKERDRHHERV